MAPGLPRARPRQRQQAAGPARPCRHGRICKQHPELAKDAVAALLATISTLADDPALLASLRRRTLLEQGIELIDGAHCPLCDSPWESERHLRDHLAIKLEKSDEAQRLQKDLFASASVLDQALSSWLSQLAAIRRLAAALEDEATVRHKLKAGSITDDQPFDLVDRVTVSTGNIQITLRGVGKRKLPIKIPWQQKPKAEAQAHIQFASSDPGRP